MQEIEQADTRFDGNLDGWLCLASSHLPMLVLAIEYHDFDHRYSATIPPPFKPGREWVAIDHQTAGNACHHHQLWATFLQVSDSIQLGIERLDDYYEDSLLGMVGKPSLNQLNQYRQNLKEFLGNEVDCDRSYMDLEEGYYPIDVEFLPLLTTEAFPKDLSELLEPVETQDFQDWQQKFREWQVHHPKFKLLVIGHNND